MSSSSRYAITPTAAQCDADYHYGRQLTKLQDEILSLNKAIDEMAAEHQRETSMRARALTYLNMKMMWITYRLDPIIKVDQITADRMKRLFPEVAEYFTLD